MTTAVTTTMASTMTVATVATTTNNNMNTKQHNHFLQSGNTTAVFCFAQSIHHCSTSIHGESNSIKIHINSKGVNNTTTAASPTMATTRSNPSQWKLEIYNKIKQYIIDFRDESSSNNNSPCVGKDREQATTVTAAAATAMTKTN